MELGGLFEIYSRKYDCFRGVYGFMCNGDARELIRMLPDGSVDHVVTDPPYGVGYDDFDDSGVFFELEPEMYRVAGRDSWLVFFYPIKKILDASRIRMFEYVWTLVYLFSMTWSMTWTRLGANSLYSIVMVFKKGNPKTQVKRRDVIFSYELPVVVESPRSGVFKPTGVVSELLIMFTKPGDIVLDPFAGYGTIPLVCELSERRWVAFEIDREKYLVAREILKNRRVERINKIRERLGLPPERTSRGRRG